MAVSLDDSPPSQGPSCPVCFRDYSDSESQLIPRILQCGHTYCTECLERLLNTEPDDEYQQVVLNIRYAGHEWTTTRSYPRAHSRALYANTDLKCPTCKSLNHIQNSDVSTLTKNFALLGCRPQSATPSKSKHFCKDHNHEKRIYCNDCRTLICAYCQLYGGHMGHDYMVASEASKPSIESLKSADVSLSDDLKKLTTGEGEVNHSISKLSRMRRKCERRVRRYFGQAVQKLESQKDFLLHEVASWTEEQMFILSAQLDMLTSASRELKSIQSTCQSLVIGDPLDALTENQRVEEEVTKLREQIQELSLQPLINPWMHIKEEGSSDVALSMLMDNFKLTYDTDASGDKDSEATGEDPGDLSSNESDSSSGSIIGGEGLSDVLESYRLRSRERRGIPTNTNELGGTRRKQVYSQETQDMTSANFAPMDGAMALESPSHPSGHDLNWISVPSVINAPTSNFSMLTQRRMQSMNMSQLLDDSGSNSDADNFHTRDSDHELEDGSGPPHHHSHDLAAASEGAGTGVDSVLDSLEIRRHWNFLNRLSPESGESSKEEEEEEVEEEDDEENEMGFQPMVSLAYATEGRSAHSDSSSSPGPGPSHGLNSDFAFPHHLSLPVNAGNPDDEVVFPSSPQYSWTDHLNGHSRALRLNIGSSGLLQLSIPPNTVGNQNNTSNSNTDEADIDN